MRKSTPYRLGIYQCETAQKISVDLILRFCFGLLKNLNWERRGKTNFDTNNNKYDAK